MDPEFDEIIRNLPADFDEKIMEEAQKKKRRLEEAPATIPKRARKLKRCGECGKEVSTRDMARHRRIHWQVCYDCPYCNYKGGRSLDYMRHHYRKFHADANHKCKNCGWQFASEDAFFEEPHLSTCIKCVGQEHQQVEPLPVDDNVPLFFHDPLDPPEATEPFWADPIIAAYADNDDVVALVNNNWSHFRQHFSTDSALVHEYRFRSTGMDVHHFTIANALKHIYSGVNAVFNINFGITSLLRRDVVGGPSQFKIFTSENNRQNILERNMLIHDLARIPYTTYENFWVTL